jgi:UDP-glucose 4-epimerase
MSIKRWIVTGGSGFLGSEICRQLSKSNLSFINLDRLEPRHTHSGKFIKGEISNPQEVIKEYKDLEFGVIHTAALKSVIDSILNPSLFEKNNFEDSVTFFDIVTQFNCRKFIFVSSAAVYGDQAEAVSEKSACNPVSRYGKTKRDFEEYLMANQSKSPVSISIVRPFNIVGTNSSDQLSGSVITKILESILLKKLFSLKYLNEVDEFKNQKVPVRDYIDVTDVASLIIALATSQQTHLEICNASSGIGTNLYQLIQMCEVIASDDVQVEMKPLDKEEIPYSVGDNLKSTEIVAWLPKVSLMKSISQEFQNLNKQGFYK